MKLGPMTKLGKRNTAMSKKIDDDDMSASYDVIDIVFFFMANFEQFGCRFPDARSVIVIF